MVQLYSTPTPCPLNACLRKIKATSIIYYLFQQHLKKGPLPSNLCVKVEAYLNNHQLANSDMFQIGKQSLFTFCNSSFP